MKFNIIDQKINDISEFHTYLKHSLMPCESQNIEDVYTYECDFATKEKLNMLVVRNSIAFEQYLAFLKEKNSDDFLDNRNTFKISNSSDQPIQAWLAFLEKLANENFVVFTGADNIPTQLEVLREGEHKLVLWNSDENEKLEAFTKLWQEKQCFFIVKARYLELFKQLISMEEIVYGDINNFFDSISFLGIITESGNSLILLSALNDINFIIQALSK